MTVLSSMQNPRIKSLLALAKPRDRARRGVFALEGAREMARALRCNYEVVEVYLCEGVLSADARAILAGLPKATVRTQVSAPVFAKLAVRETSDGLIMVLRQKAPTLAALELPVNPLLLAVQGIEKPGNLGALLRSADGAGAAAVVLLDQTVDLYNPLVLRASLGTAFHLPVVAASSLELRQFCQIRGLRIAAAALAAGAQIYTDVDFTGPTVLLLGTEAHGLSPDWLEYADTAVKIPMLGIADSLNVSVAGAVLLYEALRQRA